MRFATRLDDSVVVDPHTIRNGSPGVVALIGDPLHHTDASLKLFTSWPAVILPPPLATALAIAASGRIPTGGLVIAGRPSDLVDAAGHIDLLIVHPCRRADEAATATDLIATISSHPTPPNPHHEPLLVSPTAIRPVHLRQPVTA